jgi:hypothetical protein
MTLTPKQLALLCLVCMSAGWWLSSSPSSPVNPTPAPDRPVLRWLAKAAKNLLWIALIAEEPKGQECLVQQQIGDDGYPVLNHGRSF